MCPWQNWKATGLYFCEEAVCGWVKQPANSYSNVGYLIVAALVLHYWGKSNPRMARQLALVLLLIGIGSFFLHASLTFAGEIADLFGMFLFSARLLVWNTKRLWRRTFSEGWYWLLALVPTALMLLFGSVGIFIFQLEMAALVAMEFILWKKGAREGYRSVFILVALFIVAYILWLLDVLHGWCDPQNHWFSGHVAWHLLTAVSFLPLARFYSRFYK